VGKVNIRSAVSRLCTFAIGLLLSGCATILEGPVQAIRVHCQPSEGIHVLVNGKGTQLSTGEILLDKNRDAHFVTFTKEGYSQNTSYFNREINPFWPVANLIWGPAFPLAVLIDWHTAAVYRIDPRDVHIVLRPET